MSSTLYFQAKLPSQIDSDDDDDEKPRTYKDSVPHTSKDTSLAMEHMEIKGPATDSDDDGKPSKAKAVSDWIMNKFKPSTNGGDPCGGSLESYAPLTHDNFHDSLDSDAAAGTPGKKSEHTLAMTDQSSDEEAFGRSLADREESSSSSSGSPKPTKRKKNKHNSSSSASTPFGSEHQHLAGIEVEIESSCSNDDCLYRKRYLNTVWRLHKRHIVLACAFLLVWLFGILIGACGSGKCGANRGGNDSNVSALNNAESGASCNGEGTNDNQSLPDGPDESGHKPANPDDSTTQQPAITNPAPDFLGPNTFVFDPSMSTAEIRSKADEIFKQQRNNEMGSQRYALLFKPGIYGSVTEPLMIQIGYYTEVAGLGANPTDVRILGKIEVYNRCFEADPYQDGKFIPTDNSEEGLCFALNSFWRGLSNLAIQIITPSYQDTCRATAMFWAISQAASMRRVSIDGGDVSLMDYCSNPAYASGGFIADTKVGGKIISGSQQQFLTRNSNVGEWSGSAWNQVLMGVTGAPADDSSYPDPAITTIEMNPVNREKPFLYMDDTGNYHVFVPAFTTATKDTSWSTGGTTGRSMPISDFYVAKPGDPVAVINDQLNSGKHLLFTPGQYDVAETIHVKRADTVVLGLGLATLTAVDGAIPLKVDSQPGIIVAGVTVDGGLTLSPVLFQVGELGDALGNNGDPNNPITLSDVYFRIGGPHIGKSNVCLEINSNHVLVDHTWVWRADHGVEDFDKSDGFDGDTERWATNTGLNGVIVNGNDVTATGLFVEHFQEYNLCWNGERGRVYFFQNELPYEPPSQEEWTADDGTIGWAAYKVGENVQDHELWCGGVYCYNRNNPEVVTTNAFEVPNRDGVTLNRIYTRNLSGPGTIQHIVNGVGRSVTDAERGPFYVIRYP